MTQAQFMRAAILELIRVNSVVLEFNIRNSHMPKKVKDDMLEKSNTKQALEQLTNAHNELLNK